MNEKDIEKAGGATRAQLEGVRGLAAGAAAAVKKSVRGPLAIIGNSFHDTYTWGGTAPSVTKKASGIVHWVSRRLGQAIIFDKTMSKGVDGQNSSDYLARFDTDITPLGPSVVWIGNDTNAPPQGIAVATSVSNYRAMVEKTLQLGAVPLIELIPPRSSWTGGPSGAQATTYRRTMDQINANLRGLCAEYGAVAVDYGPYWQDPSLTEWKPLAANVDTTIGLHPTAYGAFLSGKMAAGALAAAGVVPTPKLFRNLGGSASLYDGTENPYGNRLPNSAMRGTGGTANTGVSGTVPDSFVVGRSSGSVGTLVGSQVPRPDGLPGNCWQAAITASGGSVNEQFSLVTNPTKINVTAGEKIAALVNVYCSGTGQRGFYLRARFQTAGSATIADMYDGEVGALPSDDWNGVFLTEPLVVPSGVTTVEWMAYITVDGSAGASVALKMMDAAIVRLP